MERFPLRKSYILFVLEGGRCRSRYEKGRRGEKLTLLKRERQPILISILLEKWLKFSLTVGGEDS